MGFVQKWPFFQLFLFLGNIGQENGFYDILEEKSAQEAQKVEKLTFFQRGYPMILVQK